MSFWQKRNQDLDDEISSHMKLAARDIGEEAARREFGNVALVKEVTRQMWGFSSLESCLQDLRYALRTLGKNPAYTLIAVLSLALGIGANTAIFSLIDSILLRSLPVHNPDELVSVGDTAAIGNVQGGSGGDVNIFSYPFYERFSQENTVFTGVYATGPSKRLNLQDTAEHPLGRFVSLNYFSVLGVAPFLGRSFSQGALPEAVISYAYWDRYFQRAPDVIGRKLRINGVSFTVIGVTPREFFGDIVGYQTDIWFPIESQPLANPGRNFLRDPKTQWLLLMGRLKPGVSLAQAIAITNSLGLQLLKEQDPTATPADIKVLMSERIPVNLAAGGFSRIRHTFSKPLWLLMILVALVLLICCVNVANLQLARAASRAREIGLRLAIGASRSRLLRQFMTESLALAAMGAFAGLFFAVIIGHLLLGLVARNNRLPIDFQLSGSTLFFTLTLALLASLFFGLAPALYATKASVAGNLKESKTGAQRFGKGLVVFQIVLSWVLLFGSGLFIRTLENLEKIDVGYRRDQLIIAELDPTASGYHDQSLVQLAISVTDKLKNAPGIRSASVSENGLFSNTESMGGVQTPGFTPRSNDDQICHYDRVGSGYFDTVGTPLLAGRAIDQRDLNSTSRVAVVNESMARFYFPGVTPVGRTFSSDDGKTWMTIIGEVRDAKQNNLRDPAARRYYLPFALNNNEAITSIKVELRSYLPATDAERLIRARIKSLDPNLQINSISSAQTLIDDDLVEERLIAKLSGAFSLLALVLAGIGLYGVMSYLTQRRVMEMGIRMALGASRSNVVGMVLRDTLLVTAAGLGIGIVAAVFLSKLVSTSLYGIAAFDPLTAFGASLCIVAAAFLAGWVPARRASKVDPMVALRTE